MVRDLEKLVKLEHPADLSEMAIKSMNVCPTLLNLDLTDIECFAEPGPIVHVDLGLDQIEELEE
jgi:hypothetical protein